MKRLFNLFLVFIFLITTGNVFGSFANPQETIIKFSPQIIQIANKYPKDPEILLGVAELLTNGDVRHLKTANKEYKKIIKMKNKEYNKIAYEYFATEPFDKYSNKWWNAWDDLRSDKGFYNKYIKKRGRPPEIDFASNSSDNPSKKEWQNELKADPLMSYLIKKIKPKNTLNRSVKLIPLKNFKQAYSIVREGIKKELYSTIKKIDKYENKDPNNSYYNYLKASLYRDASKYLNGNTRSLMINEIQKGINKKYFSAYQKEIVKAEIKVLDKISNFPVSDKTYNVYFGLNSFPYDKYLLSYDLARMGINFEKSKDITDAKKFYDLALKVENQPIKDIVLSATEIYTSLCFRISIYERLRKIYEETGDRKREKQTLNKIENLKIKYENTLKEEKILWFKANKIFLSNNGQKAIEIYLKMLPEMGQPKAVKKIVNLFYKK